MLEGRIDNGAHLLDVRVYYEDTDFSGNVYHANYLKFCERARSDFLRIIGLDQSAMFAERTAFVVRRMNCDFLKPSKFDDLLLVETLPGEIAGARFELRQRVLRHGDVLFVAEVTAVLINQQGKPKRLTPELVKAISRLS